jgi:integrase
VLRRCCERAGIRACTFHELRHTYATLLIEAGRPLTDVRNLLGHRYYSTTANYYIHLTDDGSAAAAQSVDDLLDDGEEGT